LRLLLLFISASEPKLEGGSSGLDLDDRTSVKLWLLKRLEGPLMGLAAVSL